MKKGFKVFLLISHGVYKEISYAELLLKCETDQEYRDKKFYPLNGILMEVSKKDYAELYKADRRQKYLEEEAVLHREISFNALDGDEMNGEEAVSSPGDNVQEAAEQAVMTEHL